MRETLLSHADPAGQATACFSRSGARNRANRRPFTHNQKAVPDPIPVGAVSLNADSTTGGESTKASQADIIQIPSNALHWFKVDSGKRI
jgi:hypothetical protein